VRTSRFLSDVAKKVIFKCNDYREKESNNIFEGNDQSVTEHLTISRGT
jgi:hypothetical protein